MNDAQAIVVITLLASVVTGALGYGFSSITVPLALFRFSGRVLNPALVIVELGVNLYSLVLNRAALRVLFPRVAPMIVGIVPGVAAGSLLLSRANPEAMKLATFAVLLPLLLLQASGLRAPLRREREASVPFGVGVGLLYSVTTISGPPLALFFNNQGLAKTDFKAALALVRFAESVLTLVAYAALGLFSTESATLAQWIVPSVIVGMPLGHWLIARINVETFRRVCMSFDAWIVTFGLFRLLRSYDGFLALAYTVAVAAIVIDVLLLGRFFLQRRR